MVIQLIYWLVVDLPLWKYEFVSLDDYSQYMEEKNMFQTTNQYIYIYDRHSYLLNEHNTQ